MTARTKDKTSRVMKTSNVDINVISATVSATSPVTYLTPDEINALCGALDQAARKFLKKRGFKVGVVVAQLGQPLQAETLYTTEDVNRNPMKKTVLTVMPYCFRTDDGRVFMRTGPTLDDLAYRMRYSHVFGEKTQTISTKDAILCAEYLCALREILTMTKRARDEWVSLNVSAKDHT